MKKLIRRLLEISVGVVLLVVSVGVIFFSTSAMQRLARHVNPGTFIFSTGIAYVGGLVGIGVGVALITDEFRKSKRRR